MWFSIVRTDIKQSIRGNCCQFEDQTVFEMQLWEHFHISSTGKCLKTTLSLTFPRARIRRGSCHTYAVPRLPWELWLPWCSTRFRLCGTTKAKVTRWWWSLCKTDYACWKESCLALRRKLPCCRDIWRTTEATRDKTEHEIRSWSGAMSQWVHT